MPIDPTRRPLLPPLTSRTGKTERAANETRGRAADTAAQPGAREQLRHSAAELARALAVCTDADERRRLRQRFLRQVLTQAMPRSVARYPDLRGLLSDLDAAFEGSDELKARLERALAAASKR
jgi:hypothetical protein